MSLRLISFVFNLVGNGNAKKTVEAMTVSGERPAVVDSRGRAKEAKTGPIRAGCRVMQIDS